MSVSVRLLAATFSVDPFTTLPEENVDLYIHEERDDEGHVERHDGGVYDEGGVGDLTHGAVTRS